MKEPIAESFDFIFSLVIPYRNNMNNDDVHLNRVRPMIQKHICFEVPR